LPDALVINAIDAMPRGGNLWLRTRFKTPAELVFQVRDDGSGIDSELLERIFEPFVTTKESGKGVGLGLAVSHNIVERHHGRIEVESEVGKGTIFTLSLPQSSGELPPRAAVGNSDGVRSR